MKQTRTKAVVMVKEKNLSKKKMKRSSLTITLAFWMSEMPSRRNCFKLKQQKKKTKICVGLGWKGKLTN